MNRIEEHAFRPVIPESEIARFAVSLAEDVWRTVDSCLAAERALDSFLTPTGELVETEPSRKEVAALIHEQVREWLGQRERVILPTKP